MATETDKESSERNGLRQADKSSQAGTSGDADNGSNNEATKKPAWKGILGALLAALGLVLVSNAITIAGRGGKEVVAVFNYLEFLFEGIPSLVFGLISISIGIVLARKGGWAWFRNWWYLWILVPLVPLAVLGIAPAHRATHIGGVVFDLGETMPWIQCIALVRGERGVRCHRGQFERTQPCAIERQIVDVMQQDKRYPLQVIEVKQAEVERRCGIVDCSKVVRNDERNSRIFVVCPTVTEMSVAEITRLVTEIYFRLGAPADEYFISFFALANMVGYKTDWKLDDSVNSGEWAKAYLGEYYTHSHEITLWPAIPEKRVVRELPLHRDLD